MADVRIGTVVLLFVLLSVTTGSCADVKDGMVDNFDDLPRTRNGANGGMIPLFDMLKIFLNDVVQHKTIGDVIDDFDIESFSDFGEDVFLERWNEWLLYFLGFLVCIVVGVLFVLIMPICGCCYCCCRNYCCCCCFRRCRKKPRHEKPSSKCKRVGYGITLFIMSSFLLASVICVYVSNGMMQGELGQEGVVSDLSSGLEQVEDYLDDSVADINETLLQEMFKTTDKIFTLLDSLPDDSLQAIEDEYQIGYMLNHLDEFTSRLPELSSYFEQMYNLTEQLKVEVVYLDANLTTSRNNLELLLASCSGTVSCDSAESQLHLVAPDATYNISTTEVAVAKIGVDEAIDSGLLADVETAKTAYKNITYQVHNQTTHEIEELKSLVQEIEDEVEDFYNDFSSAVNNMSFNEIYDAFDTTQEILDDYSFYYTNSIWVLNTLLLFITICCFLGLLFGNVLHRPKAWNGRMSCTTHQGANWLMAGIAFTFFFTWLFMLLVTLHFAVGGALETFGCRHLVGYDDTMVKIEEMIINETGLDYNISIKETIDSCEKDAALYEAGNLEENGYNITELLDLEQYGIYDAFEKLKNVTIDIGHVDILDPEVNQTVIKLDSVLKDVDYDSYNDELNKGVTQIDLLEYIKLLDKAIDEVGRNDPLAVLIQAEADKLDELYTTDVTKMEGSREELSAAVTGAHGITSSADLTDLMLQLTDSQNKLNEHGAEIVTDLLVEYAEESLKYIEDYTVYTEDAIRQDVGSCRQLYDAGQTLVYGPCLYFLEPFNAFWFCYGWFIFFSIPTIIFASCLARLYRETTLISSVGHSDKADEIAVTTITEKSPSVLDSNKVEPLPPDNRGEVINYGDFTGRSSYTFEIQEKGEW